MSDASSSKGSKKREPIPLTPKILLLLDILKPNKGRKTKLLTDHLIWQRVLPSPKEDMLQQSEQKAKREVERQQAAEEKAKHIVATEQQAAYAQEVIQADIVATFGRRSKEAALAAGSTIERAMNAEEKAAAEAEASMADASAMREQGTGRNTK